ncbi:MAG: general secretion pathway protein GspK [Planctomycetes bacterium]|nr:general secretion pathway protein GspK [Planctomycetota bacterium]
MPRAARPLPRRERRDRRRRNEAVAPVRPMRSRKRPTGGARGGQRGVALLLVLIVLLLVATLATEIAITARTHGQLASHAINDFLLRSVVDGRRQICIAALKYDQSLGDKIDTESDPWSWHNSSTLSSWGEAAGNETTSESAASDEAAAKARAYRNRDVKILAWCEDERGKLNLRGLQWEEDAPTFIQTKAALIRLIDRYREKWSDVDLNDSEATEMADALIEWIRDREDTDSNPMPASKTKRGRLVSLEDLLRVPGGKWSPERLYDIRDPKSTRDGDRSRSVSGPASDAADAAATDTSDKDWERQNGVPGLFRYITVFGEGTGTGTPKINVNTAPLPVMEALFDSGQEDFAKAALDRRRQGGNPADATATAGTDAGSGDTGGWFKSKADLTKVEGMGDDLSRYPRLNFFAEFTSEVYSIHIVATVVSGRKEGDRDDPNSESRDILASYQYREIVQRTQGGTLSLFAQRALDPIIGESEK